MNASNPTRRGRWIPWTFVGAFLVVIVANGTLIFYALHSWTGLATDHAYERGLGFNRQVAAMRAQEQTGWRARLEFPASADHADRVVLTLTDGAGAGLAGAVVTAMLKRPTDARADRALEFSDQGDGRYVAALARPLPGQWDLEAVAALGDQRYRIDRRVVMR